MNTRIDTTKKMARTLMLTVAVAASTVLTFGSANAQEVCSEEVCFENDVVFEHHFEGRWLSKSVGALGQPDDGSRGSYAARDADAYVRNDRTGNVILRYPVRCDDGMVRNPMFVVRYKDDGNRSRVRVRLVETDIFAGEPITLMDFDSDDRPTSSETQTYIGGVFDERIDLRETLGSTFLEDISIPGRSTLDGYLNCKTSTYHFEVRLTRERGGDPRIQMVGLGEQAN